MPRLARVTIPGLPHHITQRGKRSQDVFFTDADRHTYQVGAQKHNSLVMKDDEIEREGGRLDGLPDEDRESA